MGIGGVSIFISMKFQEHGYIHGYLIIGSFSQMFLAGKFQKLGLMEFSVAESGC